MAKIIKPLDKKTTPYELENGCQTINFCSWERLKPALAHAAGCEVERVKGVRADEVGIEIILES